MDRCSCPPKLMTWLIMSVTFRPVEAFVTYDCSNILKKIGQNPAPCSRTPSKGGWLPTELAGDNPAI